MEGKHSHNLLGYVQLDSSLRGTLLSEVQQPLVPESAGSHSHPESNSRDLPHSNIRINSDGMAVDCAVSKCSSSTLGLTHTHKRQRYARVVRSWIDSINSDHLIIGGACSWSFILIVILMVLFYRSEKN